MLDELSVTNLGIISSTRVEPGPGMVVVTGETGAGKTLLLGALRLLIGGGARSDLIGPDGDEAVIEGRFLFDDEELVVARRIREGRSRAYLDGSMVAARALSDRLEPKVEIVGQHDRLSLTKPNEVRRLVDRRVASPTALADYRAAWEKVTDLRHAQQQVGGDRRALERERDLVAFQAEEIVQAGFQLDEDLLLEDRSSRLGNAERIGELLAGARQALDSARREVGDAVASLRLVADLDGSLRELAEFTEGLDAELAEAVASARAAAEATEADPEALALVLQRLALLGDLRRKYGSDLEEILAFGDEAAARHVELTDLLDRAATVDADLATALTVLAEAGAKLRIERINAGNAVASAAIGHLKELGLRDPVVTINVAQAPPGPEGADKVEVLFASDSRLTPGPVKRVASGGELSRLILSLRLASGAGTARVIAFDEIDAGVGGTTALAMGAKLASLAEGRQVLCVTHLPQVAAYADTHLVMDRSDATATVRLVDGEARLEELSRMLSGLPESARGRRHAQELRAFARSRSPAGAP